MQAYKIMINLSPRKIGGIRYVVEVDESKFSKRNYNIGRNVRSPLVVGGIDILTRYVFY
ncbi:hypothetical protein H312_02939 [Anncaliia algerae PRA339]|uniref:ISXO2-like transposase domain-containing protein n=1 Tax=Anncaliia algerae PRA339 TaxID=1288291 RepID=A0A059EXT9_9MICR|nr:hypothetical protein H312_02939 [Anncaliia algerae PRA339]